MLNGGNNLKITAGLTLTLIVALNHYGSAQFINGNNWYFGNSSDALIFNKSDNEPVVVNTMATPFGTGGSVVISDQVTGDMVFYSDGENIYDASDQIIPGGTGLSGNSNLNQAAGAAPRPGTDNQEWLIFTNSGSNAPNEIQYTIVNRTLAGNATGIGQPSLGAVSGGTNVSTGITDPADGMLVIRADDPSNQNYWLIAQERTTFDYKVLEISNGVVGNIQTFNFVNANNPGSEVANFAFDSVNSRIAVSPKAQNVNVKILNIDLATGALSFDRVIFNTGNADFPTQAIFDTEWSADGSKLYISRHGGTGTEGMLYQFDFDDSLSNVNPVLSAPVFRSYGVRRGPDDRIYHLYQPNAGSSIQLGTVTIPDTIVSEVAYDPLFLGVTNFNGRQFAEQAIPNTFMFDQVLFTLLDSCSDNTTKFFPQVEPTPQFFFWDFGDGNTSFAHSPIHQYDAAGTYNVQLTVVLNGEVDMFMQTVNIIDNMVMIDLGQDTTICPGDTLILDAGASPEIISYGWSTGDTTQTIAVVDTSGTYWVAAETISGCVAYDEVQVTVYGDTAQFANIWYFGEMAGIDFNENPPVPLVDANQMNSPAAAATISDRNGNLLFYTNGVTVWNRDHDVMPGGTNIGGDSTSAQGAIIIPVPDDETLFYIFMTDPVWGDQSFDVRYAMVDMKEDQANGAVVTSNQLLYNNSTERMTSTGTQGSLIWLLTHEYGNNTFRNFPIDANGIGAWVLSSVGAVHAFDQEENGQGYMKLSPDNTRLAVALSDPPDNFVEILTFVDTTGELSDPLLIDLQETGQAYGVEFSSNSERLYVTTNGTGGSTLLQYDVDTTDAQTIEDSKFVVASDGAQYGALQTGPDGQIYMAVDNSGSLGTISNPNGDDAGSGFNQTGFDLGGRISRLGLPSFVQSFNNPPQSPSISVSGNCIGQPTNFQGSGTSDIDEYAWSFGDGSTSTDQNPTHTYARVDTFNVSLRITNRCGFDTTLFQTIEIFAIPERPTVPGVATICQDSVMLEALAMDTPGITYNWSTGDTTRVIFVDQPSTIQVSLTNAAGCNSDTVTVLVSEAVPIDLGPDNTVCQDEPISPLNVNLSGANFAWFINGVQLTNTTNFQTVDTSVPGTFEYVLEADDPLTGCVGRDTVVYTVQESPPTTVNTTPTSACGVDDGSMFINITATGNLSYQVNGPTSVPATSFTGPGNINIPNLGAGTYQVTVTNTLTGCTNQINGIGLADGNIAWTVNTNVTEDCDMGDIFATVSGPHNTLSYTLIDLSDNSTVRSGTDLEADSPLLDVPVGDYSLETIEDITQCTAQTAVTINGLPTADFTAQPIQNICGNQGTVTATPSVGSITLTWVGPSPTSIVGSPVGNTVTVQEEGQYFITSSATGLCPVTDSVQVFLNDLPIVDVQIDGDECDGQRTLIATVTNQPNDNYSYLWSTGANTPEITVTQSGSYEVTVRNQATGCLSTGDVNVSVLPVLDVLITAEPNCDNNETVFLIAEANITADVSFAWFGPDGELLPNDTTAILEASESGLYTVEINRNNTPCTATDDFDITIIPIDEEDLLLPPQSTFCSLDPATSSVTLDPGQFNSYEWRLLPDEEIISTAPTLTVSEPGRYEVTLSNGVTCIRDFTDVIEDCRPQIFAPNAFSPNGNGQNEEWFVYANPYVGDFTIFIYTRWGELVFQSNSIDFRWDGIYKGRPLPVSSYAYVMRFTSALEPESGEIEQHGGVQIVK